MSVFSYVHIQGPVIEYCTSALMIVPLGIRQNRLPIILHWVGVRKVSGPFHLTKIGLLLPIKPQHCTFKPNKISNQGNRRHQTPVACESVWIYVAVWNPCRPLVSQFRLTTILYLHRMCLLDSGILHQLQQNEDAMKKCDVIHQHVSQRR